MVTGLEIVVTGYNILVTNGNIVTTRDDNLVIVSKILVTGGNRKKLLGTVYNHS
jgi:hypothetical protein